ncbi:MAG: DegT/DnrJ/EryC1/StrS family aminotransferase [Halomonas sp.]|nr:DegT/DnrJ/EryC1/StrS family aminotransferase [Halomonas sp.]MCC5881591.1 DegT/DnrJ/EryC1/StrS family aminotransferase [Halomonas sp.]
MIPVASPYLPSRERLDRYIDGIYSRRWLTNNGPLLEELTTRLEDYLGVENLLLVSNGTLALQIAYRVLNITGPGMKGADNERPEVITTPFTFVATSSSLAWEGATPRFVDIDPTTWCMNPKGIRSAITHRTRGIVPVHVFGNGCDVDAIDELAAEYDLKVVYDGAHAFGVKHRGKSLLRAGDATTLSFHSTKLFHTIEGGAIVFRHREDLLRAQRMIGFGIKNPEEIDLLGINAKMNEFQAAMGLCNLDEIEVNLGKRKKIWDLYTRELEPRYQLQEWHPECTRNYAYFPLLFESESQATAIQAHLLSNGCQARRYFYPSLDSIDFLGGGEAMPTSRDVASRILCLPLQSDMDTESAQRILACIP